ncbi:MAG TPA: orotate phosphoribosyltransferase, partial [Alphaproteobacteria bacterium]|nr:orotate phosphoribosyltransferase [Alphaproteobacteria bacterium]
LAHVDFPSWDPNDLPPHLAGTPAIKPGSRGLA